MDLIFAETIIISVALAAAAFKAVQIVIEEIIDDRFPTDCQA
jgi:hypothetical protein